MGQNLYIYKQSQRSAPTDWTRAITDWYEEVTLFSNKWVKPFKYLMNIGSDCEKFFNHFSLFQVQSSNRSLHGDDLVQHQQSWVRSNGVQRWKMVREVVYLQLRPRWELYQWPDVQSW